ncbi:MAG: hypothetical protein AAF478_05230 [Pseudomonadota bacterium]
MKRRTKIVIAGIAGAIALGGIAVAAQGYSEHKKMKRMFSPDKIMEQIDTNGDLAASREELTALAGSYFSQADANQDNLVTKAEIVTALEASNLPDKLKRRSGRVADRIVRQGDINLDGNLTLVELENRITKFHALADWNDDNAVEIAEIKRLRGGFGHRWRGKRDHGE